MIRRLLLRNFKCFAERSIPLSPLTLLSGVNGTGKSSVLQALLLLRQSMEQGMLVTGRLALNGELVQVGTASDALYENAEKQEIGFELDAEPGGSTSWLFRHDPETDVLQADPPPPDVKSWLMASIFQPGFQYLSAERIGPRTTFATSDVVVRGLHQVGIQGEFATHYLALNEKRKVACEKLLHPSAVSHGLKDQVEAWLDNVSPGTRLRLTPYSGMDLVQLQFQFVSGRDVTRAFRPTNVGFGLTYTLPILVAVLGAQKGALILLENPEAHLHPKGQAAMGEFLARAADAGIQLIVETHSDHVLNGVRLAVARKLLDPGSVALHFFARPERDAVSKHEMLSPRMDAHGRIDPWPDNFFDQWDKSLEELIRIEEGGER